MNTKVLAWPKLFDGRVFASTERRWGGQIADKRTRRGNGSGIGDLDEGDIAEDGNGWGDGDGYSRGGGFGDGDDVGFGDGGGGMEDDDE